MESKNEYIFIRSIDEVDPKKLTIRDLNKKFIDENGRKYAIRFDFKTRKIEFVRIASSYIEAQKIKQEILKNKNSNIDMEFSSPPIEENIKEIPSDFNFQTKNEQNINFEFNFSEESIFDENQFFIELEKITKKNIDSLKAIEKGLNRAQLVETNHSLFSRFMEIQKEIEIKCYELGEEAIKFLKEILYFPRTLNYYLSKAPDSIRKKIENKSSSEQFEYLKRYEIHKYFKELFDNLLNLTKKLENFFYQLPPIERERRPLVDLTSSFSEIKDSTEYLIKKLNQWHTKYQS